MTLRYCAFGLSICSTASIPGLRRAENSDSACDLEIFFGFSPSKDSSVTLPDARLTYTSAITDDAGEPSLRMWHLANRKLFHVAYSDGTRFWFDSAGTKLWVTWTEGSSPESVALYLLGPMFALILRYRGIVCLHASAVISNGRAIVFVGPEESGKSTTAAAFGRRGSAILSDDVVPLREQDGSFLALPGSPHLRLWPDSVEMLFGPHTSLPQLLPNWEKRRLSEGDYRSIFSERACELAAIYLLKGRRADPLAPRLDAVDQQNALISLIANSYASKAIESAMRAEELTFFGRLLSSVRVRQLTPHSDGSQLDRLCDLVCNDLSASSAVPKSFPQAGAPKKPF